MEYHIRCDPKDISRYCFTPGSPDRAKKIAAHFEAAKFVSDSRGYLVYSGQYEGIFMTVCATNMGGPTVAIALEELAHMGADTFIRVGSCGVFKEGLGPGDIIISTGTYRAGGTSLAYLPLNFPAVPTFDVTLALKESAAELGYPVHTGLGIAGDAFYAPRRQTDEMFREIVKAGVISVEMESDTLYIVGAYRGWRTGALFASDGAPGQVKPESGEAAFREGEERSIQIALRAMAKIARRDAANH
ncbi:MAG TPA: nucleoside phosphorylase [Anaerolineales bacterium]|nr:nucleoside phosphorylase [Anaerolineales bacterium]